MTLSDGGCDGVVVNDGERGKIGCDVVMRGDGDGQCSGYI